MVGFMGFTLLCIQSARRLARNSVGQIVNSVDIVSKQSLVPKSLLQEKYFDLLNDPSQKVVVGLGPAGTGKTLFACHSAIQHLKEKAVNKIVITRPFVSVDENIGFLPGSIKDKMDPFTRPLMDIFLEYYSQSELNHLIHVNKIEISTLGFMRGRTFKNCFIVADEMQNSSPSQMKMLLTRLGEETRLVITGDLNQSDLGAKNGLNDFYSRIRGRTIPMIESVEFENADVQRSPIVSTILGLYDEDVAVADESCDCDSRITEGCGESCECDAATAVDECACDSCITEGCGKSCACDVESPDKEGDESRETL
jgi:phosphate starvation-inducible PhoH-like protein